MRGISIITFAFLFFGIGNLFYYLFMMSDSHAEVKCPSCAPIKYDVNHCPICKACPSIGDIFVTQSPSLQSLPTTPIVSHVNTQPPTIEKITFPTPSRSESFVRVVCGYLGSGSGPASKRVSSLSMTSSNLFFLTGLHSSWLKVLEAIHDPHLWKVDLYITMDMPIANIEVINLIYNQLNCTKQKRLNREEPSKCIIVEGFTSYLTQKTREDFHIHKYLHFAESIASFNSKDVDLSIYDWVMRTDVDSLLAPHFANFTPSNPLVGYDPYHTEFTLHRLRRIADDLGLNHNGSYTPFIKNVGPTWYGPRQVIVECMNLSSFLMNYLTLYEFATWDKSAQISSSGWMDWHFGVLSLYAGHISTNHFTPIYGWYQDIGSLDWHMATNTDIANHYHLSLHSWQGGRERFTKSDWTGGNTFSNINLASLEESSKFNVLNYSLLMLESSRRKYFPNDSDHSSMKRS